jgi:hypothetical protein
MPIIPTPRGGKTLLSPGGKAKPKFVPATLTAAQQRAVDATAAAVRRGPLPKGTPMVNVGGGVTEPVNTKALRAHLIQAGYRIPATGGFDRTLKGALGDYLQVSPTHPLSAALAQALGHTTLTGNRNPSRFNALLNPKTKSVVSTVKIDKRGNVYPTTSAPPAADNSGGSVNFGAIGNPNTYSPISELLANDGSHSIDPAYADKMAGLQYDGQIADLADQIKGAPEQGAQNLHDIQHWYDLVQASQKTAGVRDAAAGQAGVGSIRDANAAILSSLGGAANPAGATVAAAGLGDMGTLEANAVTQNEYNTDLAPILKLEQSGALAHETARQSQLAAELASQMRNLKGERGQAVATNQYGILKDNNAASDNYFSRLMAIKAQNAAGAQSNFGNRRSVVEDQIAATLNGIKATAALTSAQAKAAQNANPTKAVDMSKIAKVASGLLGVDAQGRLPAGTTPAQAAQKIAAALISQGLTRGSSEYQTLGQQLYGTFKGSDGSPLQAQPGWFTGNG